MNTFPLPSPLPLSGCTQVFGLSRIKGSRHQTLAPAVDSGEGLGPDEELSQLQVNEQVIDLTPHEVSWSEMRTTHIAEPAEENEQSWTVSDLQEKADFHRIFVEVFSDTLSGLDEAINVQIFDLKKILQEPATKAPHKEWAKISLAIESLGKLVAKKIKAKETPRTHTFVQNGQTIETRTIAGLSATHSGVKLNFIQQNLSALAVISNQRWVEHAKSVIVNNLVDHYCEKYDFAYEKSQSTKISAETNFLPLSVGASLRHTCTEATDMEGNFFTKKIGAVGLTAGAELGVNFLKTMGMSLVNTGGGVTLGAGNLEEYAKIKKMVLNEFDKLIEEHAGNDALIPFTCRYSALGQAERLPGDQITIDNFAQIRRQYQSAYQRSNNHFRLQRAAAAAHKAAGLLQPLPPLPQLKPVELEDCSPLQATIVALDGDVAASLGPKIEAMGYQLAGINASGAVDINRSTVSFERRTPALEKLMALMRSIPSEHGPVNMDQEQEPIESDLIADIAGLKRTEAVADFVDTIGCFSDVIKQKEQIIAEVNRKGQQFLNMLAQDYHRYQRAMDDPHQPSFLTRLWRLLRSLFDQPDNSPRGGKRQPLPGLRDIGAGRSVEDNLAIWERNFTRLKNEFEFYSTLQSQLVQGAKGAEQSIQHFHAYYHAKDPEHCLYHMQLLNMKAAVELFKLERARGNQIDDDDAEAIAIARHKQAMLQFEKVLNKPGFDIDQTKLEALTSVKDDVTVVSTSVKHSASVAVGLAPTGTQSLFSAKGAGSVEFSHKHISVPLRRGWFRDYQYSRGWLTQLGSADAVIEFFGAKLGENSVGLQDLPGLQQEVAKHFSVSMGAGRDITYTRRVFTPDLFPGIGATWLYTIGSNTKKSMTSLKVPAPLVTAGLERVESSSSLKILECSPHTTLFFLLLYHHDYSADKNLVYDKNGKDGDQTNWKEIKKNQRSALEGLFSNVAARMGADTKAKKLNKELAVIHQAILDSLVDNPNYQRQKGEEAAALNRAQQAFFDGSVAFNIAKEARIGVEAAYDNALDCFQRLMFAYCPHLNRIKAIADIAVPRKLTLKTVF